MHYYDVINPNLTFDNRYDAIKYNLSTNNEIKFNYRAAEFSKVDWKKEPTESLQELYKQRAQQIRDKYDYVVLCYSGGIDSTNMLESFYYNNIHIDEIVSVGSFSQDKTNIGDINHNREIYENVIPTLNFMNFPNTKKTIIDYTDYFKNLNNFSLYQQYGAEYYKFIGVYPSVTYLFWYDIDKFLNLKKNSAILLAAEKPYLNYEENNDAFYTYFDDASIANYCKYNFNNASRINFYTDPDAEKLIRKQLHIIKNYYIQNCIVDGEEFKHKFKSNYIESIKPLIYNLKNSLKFVAGKSGSQFLSCRDTYLIDNKNSDIFRLYKNMIGQVKQEIDIKKKYSVPSERYYIT